MSRAAGDHVLREVKLTESLQSIGNPLALIFESVQDEIVLFDIDMGEQSFIFRAANRAFLSTLEVTEKELIGRSLVEIVPGQKGLQARESFIEAVKQGNPLTLEVTDEVGGKLRSFEVTLTPIRNDGRPTHLLMVRHDITERIRAADTIPPGLREARFMRQQALEINDSVVQGLATAIYALEAGAANEAMEALRRTLNSAQEMMGDLLAKTTEDNGVEPGELSRAKTSANLPRSTDVAPQSQAVSEESEAIRVVIADDTADIRRILRYALDPGLGFEILAEAQDGAEAVRYVALYHPDIVLLDLAMPLVDGLQAIPHIRRVSPETKIAILSGYRQELVTAKARKLGVDAFVEKGASPVELVRTLQQLCPEKATEQPLTNPGVFRAFNGTDVVFLEEDARAELLLARYLHEIRGPMTVIGGVAETLGDRIDVLPSVVVREFLDSLRRNVKQALALIDALSDARRVGTGELQLVREPTDLSVLMRQTLAGLGELLKGHDVRENIAERVVAPVDHLRIRQVLANLLSNATKFSPPGATIEIDMEAAGNFCEISVTDHGSGIPEADVGDLFGKFSRLGGHTPGVGLGLYIARGIARAHGGDVVLKRSDATGSTFAVHLPLSELQL